MSYRINASGIKQAQAFTKGIRSAMETATFRAVNRVASKTRTAASKAIRQEVRLPASYVNEHLKVTQKATLQTPVAVITGRRRHTRLARYGAKQLTRSSKKARGDVLRGIATGRKQAGVSVAVKRSGSRKKMRGAFLVPLRNSGLMGVFVRTGTGPKDIVHKYGPSVHQVFRWVRAELEPQVKEDLAAEYKQQLAYELRRGARR